jgi:hypothetical protein
MPVNYPIIPTDSSVSTYKPLAAFAASMKNEEGKMLKWKERKQLLKEQVKAIKQAKDMSKGAKAALIILSIMVALGLLALVAALACDLSCGGSDTAALLVAVGGTALIVFLLMLTIKAINKKSREPKTENQ